MTLSLTELYPLFYKTQHCSIRPIIQKKKVRVCLIGTNSENGRLGRLGICA